MEMWVLGGLWVRGELGIGLMGVVWLGIRVGFEEINLKFRDGFLYVVDSFDCYWLFIFLFFV